jgi:hypothetical protein
VVVLQQQDRLRSVESGSRPCRLAAWAAILAVPTAVAGTYGMNFEHMPELKWEYGYYMVVGAILSICGVLYARFRRNGWLRRAGLTKGSPSGASWFSPASHTKICASANSGDVLRGAQSSETPNQTQSRGSSD